MTMAYLHNNLRIFLYLRDHPGTTQEKLPGILYWPIFTQRPQETAWSTAGQTGVLDLMPRAEVSSIAVTLRQPRLCLADVPACRLRALSLHGLLRCDARHHPTLCCRNRHRDGPPQGGHDARSRLRQYTFGTRQAARLRTCSGMVADAPVLDHEGLLRLGWQAS
jgi:hypothetical protein